MIQGLALITIQKYDIVTRECLHCGEETVQVGTEGLTCLQCIADGGTCCSLREFDRHVPEPKRPR